MANRLQLRRDGAQQWANVNPILAQGELGIEIDTSRLKVGDGVTAWNSLKYERPIETESNTAISQCLKCIDYLKDSITLHSKSISKDTCICKSGFYFNGLSFLRGII